MDYIITVNGKDYADALLPVMTPGAFGIKASAYARNHPYVGKAQVL